MTFETIKKVIEVQKQRGTLDKEGLLIKMDVFLLNNRITDEEYNILVELINKEDESSEPEEEQYF